MTSIINDYQWVMASIAMLNTQSVHTGAYNRSTYGNPSEKIEPSFFPLFY